MTFRPGFTLMELTIVLGMMAVFAGFASAISVPTIRSAEFDRVRETIRNELVAAQADTIGGTLDAAWGVAFTTGTVIRYRGATYATRNTAFDRVTTFADDVTIGGTRDIPFNRPFGSVTSTATIILTNGTLYATTTVNTAGAVSVQ